MASNFRQLDLNLLRVLCAVYRTGSVTEAGRQLALSQPATSNALARLRGHFGDELFVRSPRGLHPTRLAQRIAPELIAQLRALEATVTASDTFEPPSSHEHWRLSMSDLGEMMFLPALARALREHAPHCRLSNLPVPAPQVGAALVAHEIDLAIGILQPGPRGIDHELLFEEPFVALSGAHWTPPAGACGAASAWTSNARFGAGFSGRSNCVSGRPRSSAARSVKGVALPVPCSASWRRRSMRSRT